MDLVVDEKSKSSRYWRISFDASDLFSSEEYFTICYNCDDGCWIMRRNKNVGVFA